MTDWFGSQGPDSDFAEEQPTLRDDEAVTCPRCYEWAKRHHTQALFRCDNPACLWRGTSEQTPLRITSL